MAARKFASKPDELVVGHRTYQIKWLLEVEWRGHGLDMDDRGLSDHSTQTIYVRLEMDGEEVHKDCQQEILLHEVLHCCTNQSMVWNIWGTMNNHEFADVDEVVVGSLAPVLLTVFRANPEFEKWLLS